MITAIVSYPTYLTIKKLNAEVIAISSMGDQQDVKRMKNTLGITFTLIPKPNRKVTVTTWKWLQAMYLIVSSSKGISSVVLARLIGVTQPTAWRMGHVIRQMMDSKRSDAGLLQGIVELDETYVGGDPQFQQGVVHKRGKGTAKQ